MNLSKLQFYDQDVWVFDTANIFDHDLTLLISKVSEAILPNDPHNHIGDGSSMDVVIEKQPGVRFIINAGFSHYRQNFYDWPHQNFHVGQPVGVVKIRQHVFEDNLGLEHYGFFTQQDKQQPWRIQQYNELNLTDKYILGCTPLLIFNHTPTDLSAIDMTPMPSSQINPPSYLGHGKECHPRTAVGIKDDHIYFILVEGTKGGCTLQTLQNIGVDLQLDHMLNLDGGGSSQLQFFDGAQWIKSYVEPCDAQRVLGHVLILFDETLK